MRMIGPLILVVLPLAVCSFASKDSFAQKEGAEGLPAAAVQGTTARSAAGGGGAPGDVAAPQRPAPAPAYNPPAERPSSQGWSVDIGGYVRGDVSRQDRSRANP
jgi:hypothetical protein